MGYSCSGVAHRPRALIGCYCLIIYHMLVDITHSYTTTAGAHGSHVALTNG
jgi:hypothetical protein